MLLPWRTVIDNVLLPTEIFGLNSQGGGGASPELLDTVGLHGFDDKYPWELSGGMQQRASLARLLVYEPDILLMDEPFSALDEFTRERLNLELAKIHESLGRTVLYVTHNIQEAVFLSDRVVVMKPHPGEILDIIDTKLPRPRRSTSCSRSQTTELVTGSATCSSPTAAAEQEWRRGRTGLDPPGRCARRRSPPASGAVRERGIVARCSCRRHDLGASCSSGSG